MLLESDGGQFGLSDCVNTHCIVPEVAVGRFRALLEGRALMRDDV